MKKFANLGNCAAPTLVLFLALSSCGQHDPMLNLSRRTSPIVGGRRADLSTIFGTVAIEDSEGNQYCTGTLIGAATVVTAAHCLCLQAGDVEVIALAPRDLVVMAGGVSVAAAKNSQLYDVSRVVMHPGYVGMPSSSFAGTIPSDIHDIGIVVLQRAVDTLRPVPLARSDDLKGVLTIAGYGEVEERNCGDLHIAEAHSGPRSETEFTIGGVGDPDSCAGDSGGPAYRVGLEPQLVGIASRSVESVSACGTGGIYTYAAAYADWLREAANVTNAAAMSPGGGCAFARNEVSISSSPLLIVAGLGLRRLRRKRRGPALATPPASTTRK